MKKTIPRIRFEDQILKPEFSDVKAKLPEGVYPCWANHVMMTISG